jgi:hypothetical protein
MATLFGLVMLTHQVGGFLGAWLGGKVFEATGSYDWVWYIDIVLAVGAALIHLPICQTMYIGMGGQGTGGSTLARSRSRCDCRRAGTVASSSLPRMNGGRPAKPGTMTAKRRTMPCAASLVQVQRRCGSYTTVMCLGAR